MCSITFISFLLVSLNHKHFLNWFLPPFKKKNRTVSYFLCTTLVHLLWRSEDFFQELFFLWVLEVKLKSLALVTCAKPFCQSIYTHTHKKKPLCVCLCVMHAWRPKEHSTLYPFSGVASLLTKVEKKGQNLQCPDHFPMNQPLKEHITTSISHNRDIGCSSTMTYTALIILLFAVISILRVEEKIHFYFLI